MRILQVITPSRIAGAERSTASLCEHLARAGHRVTIACKASQPLVEFFRSQGLDVRPLAIGGKANLAAPILLALLGRGTGAKIIHTQLSTAAIWGSIAARLLGIPVVAHVRALNSKEAYLMADRVIAVSNAARDHLVRQGMEGDRIDVVYSGIDPDRYRPSCSREEARRRLRLSEEQVAVGVLAHFSEKKGHEVLLSAWRAVAAAQPRAALLLAGEGAGQARLERLAADLGIAPQVRFLGYVEDALPLYAALDVVALPSTAGEGLPRTLLEAGFLGLPCVGTRLSGIPEILVDGDTGFLVPPGDAAALADRLLALGANPELRARMGAAARERIRAQFTVDAMVEGTLRSYRSAGAVI